MKICFVIGTLNYSGAEKIMLHMINHYKKNNDVSVILLAMSEKHDFIDGINQYPLDIPLSKGNKYTRTIRRQYLIRRIIKKEGFDVIISFGFVYNIDVVTACLFSKAKIILCERNDPKYDPRSKIQRLRRILFYRFADFFVFQTENIQKFFSKKIRKKSIVIPNFIESIPEKTEYYEPLKLSFSTCARLDDNQKDQSTLLKAFAIFKKQNPLYILEFYGDGPDRLKYEKLASDLGIFQSVVFHGRVKKPIEKIIHSTAFILTSRYEGMPNALIEALSRGMPCISSRCGGGGAEALIDDGVNGLLYSVGDIDALSSLMQKITNDKLRLSLSKEAVKINERLNMSEIMPLWDSVIFGVINK